MMLRLIAKYFVEKAMQPDPERYIKGLIKKYLPGYHLASNPIRKTKRANGPAMI